MEQSVNCLIHFFSSIFSWRTTRFNKCFDELFFSQFHVLSNEVGDLSTVVTGSFLPTWKIKQLRQFLKVMKMRQISENYIKLNQQKLKYLLSIYLLFDFYFYHAEKTVLSIFLPLKNYWSFKKWKNSEKISKSFLPWKRFGGNINSISNVFSVWLTNLCNHFTRSICDWSTVICIGSLLFSPDVQLKGAVNPVEKNQR